MSSPIGKTAAFEVKPESLDRALEAIRGFVEAVGQNEDRTLFYAAFRGAEHPTRFLHVFAFEDAEAEEHHRGTAWVKRFTDVLYPETVDGVTFADFELVATTEPRSGIGRRDP